MSVGQALEHPLKPNPPPTHGSSQQLCPQRPSSSQDLLPPHRLPKDPPQPLPLFWSKNSSVKMGTSKVEKESLHSPA